MKTTKSMRGVVFNEIFFTEDDLPNQTPIKHLSIVIKHQNATLDDVRLRLAMEAKASGADTVKNFRYGQKLMSLFQALIRFQWEIEYWYGEGDAVKTKK